MLYGPFDKDRLHPVGRQCAAIRPHRALKVGKQILTPAIQAGLLLKRLTFRDIFTPVAGMFLLVLILIDRQSRDNEADQRPLAG